MRQHSYRRETKNKNGFFIKILLFLIIVWGITGTWLYYSANKNLQAYHLEKSLQNVKWLKKIFYRPSNVKEMENLISLISTKNVINRESGILSNDTYKLICLNYLKENKDLEGFHKLYQYIENKKAIIPYIKGLYLFDMGDFEKAKEYLGSTEPFKNIYKSKRIPIIENILYLNLDTKKFVAKINGTEFLQNQFNQNRHYLKVYHSTIDFSLQKKAGSVLNKFNGVILLSENNKLSICFGKNVDVFSTYIEPASVIKLVTASAFLTENPSLIKFPYKCNKPLVFNKKLFYDWKKHGKLKSIEEGLACSCNLLFGEAGVKLGSEVMSEWYKKFYLDKNYYHSIEEIKFNLGKKSKEFDNSFLLARGSIGLDIPKIVPYWLIKTATTLANESKDTFPELFSSYKYLGIDNSIEITPEVGNPILDTNVLNTILNGMGKTVTWKNGSGVNAEIDGIETYLKTGTGGKKLLDSALLGYFKKNGKTYSFGIFLEQSGTATKNGAKALKELISII